MKTYELSELEIKLLLAFNLGTIEYCRETGKTRPDDTGLYKIIEKSFDLYEELYKEQSDAYIKS